MILKKVSGSYLEYMLVKEIHGTLVSHFLVNEMKKYNIRQQCNSCARQSQSMIMWIIVICLCRILDNQSHHDSNASSTNTKVARPPTKLYTWIQNDTNNYRWKVPLWTRMVYPNEGGILNNCIGFTRDSHQHLSQYIIHSIYSIPSLISSITEHQGGYLLANKKKRTR